MLETIFTCIMQEGVADCGKTCLRMIAEYWHKDFDFPHFNNLSNEKELTLLDLSEVGELIGFETICVELTTEKLINEAPLPCILHWNENHYVVLFKLEALSNSIFLFNLADPAIGIVKICRNEFEVFWKKGKPKGKALLLKLK